MKMRAIKHCYNYTTDKWIKSNINLVVEPQDFQEGAMRSAVSETEFLIIDRLGDVCLISIECGRWRQMAT